jgi:intein-encoded DNA endonuclease-like protein
VSDNVSGADNQQATLTLRESSETTRQTPFTRGEILAYVHGAMHDGSLNKRKRVRIVQRNKTWLEIIRNLLQTIGIHSWIYREGKTRSLYALETVSKELDFKFDPLRLETKQEQVMYLRGFFDAEGGVPRNGKRFYIQFTQKDYGKMCAIKKTLGDIGIESGKVHNPSKRVDPNYWRIFIPTKHHRFFAEMVGSWHPIKSKIFKERMMR